MMKKLVATSIIAAALSGPSYAQVGNYQECEARAQIDYLDCIRSGYYGTSTNYICEERRRIFIIDCVNGSDVI